MYIRTNQEEASENRNWMQNKKLAVSVWWAVWIVSSDSENRYLIHQLWNDIFFLQTVTSRIIIHLWFSVAILWVFFYHRCKRNNLHSTACCQLYFQRQCECAFKTFHFLLSLAACMQHYIVYAALVSQPVTLFEKEKLVKCCCGLKAILICAISTKTI